jgi:diacylglycerol kinase (ATP)
MSHLPRPPRQTGLRHLIAAAGNARAGLRRLGAEAAFRQELAGAALVALAYAVSGVPAAAYGASLLLFLLLVATEALNTAIEILVDRVSPGWSGFARDTKDLAGLAVACLVIANLGFAAVTLWRAWLSAG